MIFRSAISGIILLFVDMAVIMLAQQYVSSSLVAIIASSTAIWIILLDVPLWKENLRNPLKIIGLLLGFFGVGMLYLEQHLSATDHYSEKGIYILLFGSISWELGTLFTKHFFQKKKDDNAIISSAWQMLFASVAFWIVAIGKQEFSLTH